MIEFDSDSFWRVVIFILSVVSFGAISSYKITEHGRDLKEIKRKLDPEESGHRFITSGDLEMRLTSCAKLHSISTQQIIRDIKEIKDTLKKGEEKRDEARQSRDEHMGDRKSTRLNSSHIPLSRMPSSA